jgi:hypothetical protein
MPLILNYAENRNVINQDNLAKKRIVKALQQQTASSIPQTDPDLEDNANKYFDKIFELSNSIETYLFELGVFVSSEDTSKVDVEAEQSAKKAKEQAKVEAEIAKLEAKLLKIQSEVDREQNKKKPDETRIAKLEEQYFEIQDTIEELQKKLQPKLIPPPISLEDFGEEEEGLEGSARKVVKGKKLIFKEEQSIPIVAKLLNLFNSYKKAWKELIPFSAGLNTDQLTDLGVMVSTVSKSLNSFIEDTKVEIPKNKQRVYEQLFIAVDRIQTILQEIEQIYQNIYYYYSQNSSPAPTQLAPQSVGSTTGSGFAVRPYYSRTRFL